MSEYIIAVGEDDNRWYCYPIAGEIVRCKDCVYGTHFLHHDDERWQCANPYQEGDDVKPDAYCWRGERREGAES